VSLQILQDIKDLQEDVLRKILRSNKGQAMTEMVIVLPLLILVFAAIFQFTVLLMKKIQLGMLERETMFFLASDEDQGKDKDIQAFANEMGKKLGLDSQVFVTMGDKQQPGDSELEQLGQANSGQPGNNELRKINLKQLSQISFLKKFTGTYVRLDYEQGLLNLFSAVTGKRALNLSTGLFTATGGSFTFTVRGALKLKKEYSEDDNTTTDNQDTTANGQDITVDNEETE
jgi:ABC-type transport system involved in multi-copper enzyme maturation permease subunit